MQITHAHRESGQFGPWLETLERRTLLAGDSGIISGQVLAAGAAWVDATVSLYAAGTAGTSLVGSDTADASGQFQINFANLDDGTRLYLQASGGDPSTSPLLFMSVAGEVGQGLLPHVVINELSTVASTFALSQFVHGTDVFGASPGLDNAMTTFTNLVNAETGSAGAIVSNHNNGTGLDENPTSTLALWTMNTLADIVAAAAENNTNLNTLLQLTTVGGNTPTNTLQAVHNIAQHPVTLDNAALFQLAGLSSVYTPKLTEAPEAWILALHFTDGGFNAPGRMAFDADGNIWSNNNFANNPPKQSLNPGKQVTVLNPAGAPIFGSPIYGAGVHGSGYGIAIAPDGVVWFGNFANDSLSKFKPDGRPAGSIPGRFGNLNHPMGMAFDRQGNLWIANMGDPSDQSDFGSVTMYPGGDPKRALTFTRDHIDPLRGAHKPFSVAIDAHGRAWVANSGFAPIGGVIVLEVRNNRIELVAEISSAALNEPMGDLQLRPYGDFASPKTIAIDAKGNAWISNFESHMVTMIDGVTFQPADFPADPSAHTWGLAVDGSDQIWAASFSNPPLTGLMDPPVVSLLEGSGPNTGQFLYSFSNPCLQHLTALQVDASGNVWVANNWALETTPSHIVGGDGLVQFIGLSTPVKTPLLGPPEAPTITAGRFGMTGSSAQSALQSRRYERIFNLIEQITAPDDPLDETRLSL